MRVRAAAAAAQVGKLFHSCRTLLSPWQIPPVLKKVLVDGVDPLTSLPDMSAMPDLSAVVAGVRHRCVRRWG